MQEQQPIDDVADAYRAHDFVAYAPSEGKGDGYVRRYADGSWIAVTSLAMGKRPASLDEPVLVGQYCAAIQMTLTMAASDSSVVWIIADSLAEVVRAVASLRESGGDASPESLLGGDVGDALAQLVMAPITAIPLPPMPKDVS